MKTLKRNERILSIATGFLVLSIILMVSVIPGILNDTYPSANPKSAATGVALAILIRLVILILFIKFIRESRISSKNRKGEYIGIGLILLIFGFIYMDGAIAFLSHKTIPYVSILMFISVLCDFVASIMIVVLFFLKPQNAYPITHEIDEPNQ